MYNICNARVLMIKCPKEMMDDRCMRSFSKHGLSVVRIDVGACNCCLDDTSTKNFIMQLNAHIMNNDKRGINIFLVNFRNDKAVENFRYAINEAFPNNLIEFLDNPDFLDVETLVSAYLYTMKENSTRYGYSSPEEVEQLISAWEIFCAYDKACIDNNN